MKKVIGILLIGIGGYLGLAALYGLISSTSVFLSLSGPARYGQLLGAMIVVGIFGLISFFLVRWGIRVFRRGRSDRKDDSQQLPEEDSEQVF